LNKKEDTCQYWYRLNFDEASIDESTSIKLLASTILDAYKFVKDIENTYKNGLNSIE